MRFERLTVALALVVALVLAACSASVLQAEARTANAIALAGNDALPALVAAYDREGRAAIEHAATRPDADVALGAVRARWRPVWGVDAAGAPCGAQAARSTCRDGAWAAVVAAETGWALALEHQIAGQPFDLPTALRLGDALRVAVCSLRGALPAGVQLPQLPSVVCAAASGGAR